MIGFVVRRDGCWFAAPVPGSLPTPVVLAEIIDQSHTSGGGADDDFDDGDRIGGLGPDTVVAAVWAWVGRLDPHGVTIESHAGHTALLGRDDLVLLDALAAPTSVAELTSRTGLRGTPQRLARLADLGHLRTIDTDPGTGTRASSRGFPPIEPGPTGDGAPQRRAGLVSRLASRVAQRRGEYLPSPRSDRLRAVHLPTVHAVWQEQVGPPLSLGMLLASARTWNAGQLSERYDIRPLQTAAEFLEDLRRGRGPAVLLCSNYVWSVDFNLELARQAKEIRPELVVIHGGPSTPKYPADAERFLTDHADVADILVRGEAEHTLCRVLETIAPDLPHLRLDRLSDVAGLTYRRSETDTITRTGEPERITDLDTLPSPYLTGEYDHIDPAAWLFSVSIETNRGCPYGCTFCDWGSATMSRLRKFSVERVLAECEWAASHQILGVQICDANFGIITRDIAIAHGIANIRRHHRYPVGIGITPAKNTTRHLTKILDELLGSGLMVSTAISLQTTDETTLAAVDRSNISTDNYLALAADLRRRGLPLQGDLLIGLPGQTYESYKHDIQFFVDHEILPRTWTVKVLPNAPMNHPDYRAEHRIETDDHGLVISTATLNRTARERTLALRSAEAITNRFGVLRHVARVLQWDHHLAFTDLLDHLIDTTTTTPERFPLITWILTYFDLHPTTAVGWHAFYDEIRQLLAEDFGLDPHSSDLDTALRLQAFLMPAPGRTFPATITLPHDYLTYYRTATASLYTNGHASTPAHPLTHYPPADFTITADPLHLCTNGPDLGGDSRDESMLGQFWVGIGGTYELVSPLTRVAPTFRDVHIAEDALNRATAVQIRSAVADDRELGTE